jgi:hypothetical protein
MNTYNDYLHSIQLDIAKDFGLEAGGFSPVKPALSFKQAMYLNAKYPNSDEYSLSPSDKAFTIAKRYASLKKVWAK